MAGHESEHTGVGWMEPGFKARRGKTFPSLYPTFLFWKMVEGTRSRPSSHPAQNSCDSDQGCKEEEGSRNCRFRKAGDRTSGEKRHMVGWAWGGSFAPGLRG